MNVRSVNPEPRRRPLSTDIRRPQPKLKHQPKHHFIRLGFILLIGLAIFVLSAKAFGLILFSTPPQYNEIRSAIIGDCLGNENNKITYGSAITFGSCTGAAAQRWTFASDKIFLNKLDCLSVNGRSIEIAKCSNNLKQRWIRNDVGLENLADHQCLTASNQRSSLSVASCNNLINVGQAWTPTSWQGEPLSAISMPTCNQSTIGDRVACMAERQWLAWESEPSLHKTLLYDYTDGNTQEEWCADFVSYIYKQAGDPFSGGERNRWDQYNANYVRYSGNFSFHSASSGYIPKAGDVAFFDYPGGHVEIVYKGGKKPIFIYGDSGTIDPYTGNGDMAKNSIANDGAAGRVTYYLSPR